MNLTHKNLCFVVTVYLARQLSHERAPQALLVDHPKYDLTLPIGGHIELGEDPMEAVLRELREEAGYGPDEVRLLPEPKKIPGDDAMNLHPPLFMDRHQAGEHEHVSLVYMAQILTTRAPRLSPEHDDKGGFRWFSEQDLESGPGMALGNHTRFYAMHAIRLTRLRQMEEQATERRAIR